MADNMLQEVNEALRADRAAALWARYRGVVIGLVLALVLGTAGHSAYQYYQETQGSKRLSQLVAAQKLLSAGKHDEAAEAFAEVASGAAGDTRALAQIWQARALQAAGKPTEAATLLTQAAQGTPSLWTDIACLRLASLDEAAAKPCLSHNADSPLSLNRAQWAAAGAWATGDVAAAKAALEKRVLDETTSQEARTRMLAWLSIMKEEKAAK